MSNTVIIHIGVPKTGSTSIQQFLFQNCTYLLDQGLEYHETYATDDKNPDYWAHHLLAHKWGGWMNAESFPIEPDQAWKNLREDALRGENRNILISSERFADLLFSNRADEVLSFIQTILSPANVKIFAYVRNQMVLVESFYKQQVKVGLKVPPLNVYLEKQMPKFLDFFGMFEKCSQFFGSENIIVRSYENDMNIDKNIIYSFLKSCGLEIFKEDFKSIKKYNTSTSTLSTLILSNPDLKKMVQRPKYRQAIRTLFDNEITESGIKPSLLSTKQKELIVQRFKKSNDNLSKYYGTQDNLLEINLGNYMETTSIDNEKFLFSYNEITKFLKVLNEDLVDFN